jgi:cytidine deaminase
MIDHEVRAELIQEALAVRKRAYAPYSGYPVGAAVLTKDGGVYLGANVENAAFPVGMCAERVAIFAAVSDGQRDFELIVVATANGGSPCGACRQVMSEFGLDTRVITIDEGGEIHLQTDVGALLPHSFGANELTQG